VVCAFSVSANGKKGLEIISTLAFMLICCESITMKEATALRNGFGLTLAGAALVSAAVLIIGIGLTVLVMRLWWSKSDRIKRSILLDSGADIISYGMGEHSIVEIADALNSGLQVRDITWIPGTVYKTRHEDEIYDAVRLPDFEEIKNSKRKYAESFAIQYRNTDPISAKRIYECYDGAMFVVQNPPASPLTEMEMDDVYALPFMRAWHPIYDKDGGIPAFGEIKESITQARGCFGECNFCALTFDKLSLFVQTVHNL
jgi:uncharacterized radical SAM protein YgiQ